MYTTVLNIGDSYGGGIVIKINNNNTAIILDENDIFISQLKTYSESLTAANSLTINGYTDWRLPSANELQHARKVLMKDDDLSFFTTYNFKHNKYYWTTSQDNYEEYQVRYNVTRDRLNISEIVNSAYARAVRVADYSELLTTSFHDVEGTNLSFPNRSGKEDHMFEVAISETNSTAFNTSVYKSVIIQYRQHQIPTLNVSSAIEFSNPNAGNEIKEEEYKIDFKEGWNIISFPFNISTLSKVRYYNSSGVEVEENASDFNFISITEHGETYDTLKISDLFNVAVDDFIIAKDNYGSAWLPEFGFDGIPNISLHSGYQVKCNREFSMYFTAKQFYSQLDSENEDFIVYGRKIRFGAGWNFIPIPVNLEINLIDLFSEIINDVIIVKNNAGSAYLPQYNFDGIGTLYPGEGYQVKMNPFTGGNTYYELDFT